jgi:hypothetical protein
MTSNCDCWRTARAIDDYEDYRWMTAMANDDDRWTSIDDDRWMRLIYDYCWTAMAIDDDR